MPDRSTPGQRQPAANNQRAGPDKAVGKRQPAAKKQQAGKARPPLPATEPPLAVTPGPTLPERKTPPAKRATKRAAPVVAGTDEAARASRPADATSVEPPAGPELARAVLDAARARRVQTRRSHGGRPGEGRRLRGYSGPGPDPRDPQPFGAVLANLMKVRGWQQPAAQARLFGMWETVVGPELAAHSRPVKLDDGELTVEAESTAWATQLQLLTGKLLVRISDNVGRGVVKKLKVHGPTAPSWTKGPKRVMGRGPRDTYG